MNNETIEPFFTFMARHPGRKYYMKNFTLTLEQITYLDSQPNASELIRVLLDRHMRSPHAERDVAEAELGRVMHEHHVLIKSNQYLESIKGRTPSGDPIWKDDADPKVVETFRDLNRRYFEVMRRLRELDKDKF